MYRILKAEARRLPHRLRAGPPDAPRAQPRRGRSLPATSRSPSTASSPTSTRPRSSGTDGTIDWFCCPHFDSPSVFGAILDRQRGGYYRIAPTTEDWTPKQLYFPDTNVLITRFLTRDGVGEVQDFMPIHHSPRQRVPPSARPARASASAAS